MVIVIDHGIHDAKANMARDCQLLQNIADHSSEIILSFYRWKRPSITYGYFIDPARYIDMEKAQSCGYDLELDIAKRPTGGGMLFHQKDCTFTLAVPKNHSKYHTNVSDNYRWINEAIVHALSMCVNKTLTLASDVCHSHADSYRSFCMATPTIFDVIVGGKKVGGCAERKTKDGYIHQASLFLTEPDWDEISSIVVDAHAVDVMRKEVEVMSYVDRDRFCHAFIDTISVRALQI